MPDWCWIVACSGAFSELSWTLPELGQWSLTQITSRWTVVPCRGGKGSHFPGWRCALPTQSLWLGLRKQPCFLHFKGFFLGHPVDFPGAPAWGRDHRQVVLGEE